MSNITVTVNATEYPPQLKHKVIFQTYNQLKPSEAMLLVNDHDPVPLRFQFESMHPNEFTWEYLEQGPDMFQVKISKF
ncbi:DUF2249 domain-containing protein [Paenibacillus crassostreae]|uniref:DUF2249 domain-containing protein n=1 Tax=Paenibacillus crassostreae TaxID=1763538 RepID=A0A167DGB1_9BACL|nr:DUF2249 domain-containing protein [Paenibacillus crassostreae]AOZ91506.1 hypothetical protein LPB68_04290 [Paenibacillus crassostreae]OAB74335.1 hypothetical protein PNBC_09670 [Paenibacillus crassostreae]